MQIHIAMHIYIYIFIESSAVFKYVEFKYTYCSSTLYLNTFGVCLIKYTSKYFPLYSNEYKQQKVCYSVI